MPCRSSRRAHGWCFATAACSRLFSCSGSTTTPHVRPASPRRSPACTACSSSPPWSAGRLVSWWTLPSSYPSLPRRPSRSLPRRPHRPRPPPPPPSRQLRTVNSPRPRWWPLAPTTWRRRHRRAPARQCTTSVSVRSSRTPARSLGRPRRRWFPSGWRTIWASWCWSAPPSISLTASCRLSLLACKRRSSALAMRRSVTTRGCPSCDAHRMWRRTRYWPSCKSRVPSSSPTSSAAGETKGNPPRYPCSTRTTRPRAPAVATARCGRSRCPPCGPSRGGWSSCGTSSTSACLGTGFALGNTAGPPL